MKVPDKAQRNVLMYLNRNVVQPRQQESQVTGPNIYSTWLLCPRFSAFEFICPLLSLKFFFSPAKTVWFQIIDVTPL